MSEYLAVRGKTMKRLWIVLTTLTLLTVVGPPTLAKMAKNNGVELGTWNLEPKTFCVLPR